MKLMGKAAYQALAPASALGFLNVQFKNKSIYLIYHNFMRIRPNGFNVMTEGYTCPSDTSSTLSGS